MIASMWRSEDNFQEKVLSFHHVDHRVELRSSGLIVSAFSYEAISTASISPSWQHALCSSPGSIEKAGAPQNEAFVC